MLSRAFEWYRIADVQPTSETLDSRTAAVKDLIEAIDESENWDFGLGLAVGVLTGFEGCDPDSSVVKSVVRAIKDHDSAFPQDLSENALALRACAAITLGEIVVRGSDENPDRDALQIAAVLRCGLYPRPHANGKYLNQLLGELSASTLQVINAGGRARRKRPNGFGQRFEGLTEPTNVPTAWQSLLPALKGTIADIGQKMSVDGEEINILWWMFGLASETTGELIEKIPIGAAALCCGAELGSLCILPPAPSIEAMVRRSFEMGRKRSMLGEQSIDKIATDWKGPYLDLLNKNDRIKSLTRSHPALFPFAWLCDRLKESQGSNGWMGEFEQKTGIPPTHARKTADWAIQAFRERIAQRLLND